MSAPRVLIDTFNLRLDKGTGIKTYGVSLIEALNTLGYSVELLGDRKVREARIALLNEIAFYDVVEPKHDWLYRMRERRDFLTSTLFAGISATPIDRGVVSSQYAQFSRGYAKGFSRIWNAYRVYDRAFARFLAIGAFAELKLKNPPEVFHATTALPLTVPGAKLITTIHDLIPLKLPFTTLDNKKVFYSLVGKTLRKSDLVLTVSECSRRDILSIYDVDPAKVVVTYQSLPKPRPVDQPLAEALLRSHKLKPRGYVLFAGNIEPKKNLLPLVKAVGSLSKRLPLIVVGAKAWLWEKPIKEGQRYLRKNFIQMDYLARDELSALMANAACFVFPSLYEGFGLPPLEAMQVGTPVCASNASSLPEVLGDAALYFDPERSDQIRMQIERILDEPLLVQQMIERGYARVEAFSPARYASRIKDAYARVLK